MAVEQGHLIQGVLARQQDILGELGPVACADEMSGFHDGIAMMCSTQGSSQRGRSVPEARLFKADCMLQGCQQKEGRRSTRGKVGCLEVCPVVSNDLSMPTTPQSAAGMCLAVRSHSARHARQRHRLHTLVLSSRVVE